MSKSSDVVLRDVRVNDKDSILEWRNSESVRPYMYNDSIISQADHDKWFEGMIADSTKKYWVIELDESPVGVANLVNINGTSSCDWAFYLFDPGVRGRGVGSKVENFVLNYVFNVLNLDSLFCEVLETNPNVVKMHQKFGFSEVGFVESVAQREGKWVGAHKLQLTRSEYLKRF